MGKPKTPEAAPAAQPAPVPSESVSPELERAERAGREVEQQFRLLSDAKGRHQRAAQARDDADRALAEANTKLDAAMAASAANRQEDALADAAARARVRRDHAAADHQQAVEAEERLAEELRQASARHADAHRAFELAAAWSRSVTAEVGFHESARASARALVGAAATFLDAIEATRRTLEADNAATRDFHEAGGRADVLPLRDGTGPAGYLYAELCAQGAGLHVKHTPFELKHLCDLPSTSSPLRNRFEAARQLFAFIVGSLEQAARNRNAGQASRGRAEIERVADAFRSSRERVEAADKLGAQVQAEETERRRRHEDEHERRLLRSRGAVFPGEAGSKGPQTSAARASMPLPDEPPDLTVG